MNKDTLVLGLGNPLRGDDGVALAVLAVLETLPLPDSVVVLDGGTPGLETAVLLENYRRVIIIDAANMGLAAGEWRRFGREVLQSSAAMLGTLHDAGLAEALALAEALGTLPPEVVIFGVEPASVDWEEGLSAPVAAAVTAVAAAIQQEVGR